MEVICPSGLRGEVRKLRGQEANLLASRKAERQGDLYDRILRACWVRTEDPGPYAAAGIVEPESAEIPWSKILVCDRFFALVSIRVATYGPEFEFTPRCPACSGKFEWTINLSEQLPVYDLPEPSRLKISQNENRFETSIGQHRVIFSLQTGEGERRGLKKMRANREELLTTALSTRIVEVEGVEKRDLESWLKNLDVDLQMDLISQMDEVDGGLETNIEIECPHCDNIFEVNAPFVGPVFWLPSSRRKPRTPEGKRPGRQARTMGGRALDPTEG